MEYSESELNLRDCLKFQTETTNPLDMKRFCNLHPETFEIRECTKLVVSHLYSTRYSSSHKSLLIIHFNCVYAKQLSFFSRAQECHRCTNCWSGELGTGSTEFSNISIGFMTLTMIAISTTARAPAAKVTRICA